MDIGFDDRALVIKSKSSNALVVADIHLGYEVSLSEKANVDLPPQNEKMIERVEKLANRHEVTDIFLLGDIKHTIATDRQYNWSVIPQFMVRMSELGNLTIVPGNHDGELRYLLPRGIELSSSQGVVHKTNSGSVGLLHGHAWPSPELLDCEVMLVGHNHPSVRRVKAVSSPVLGRESKFRSSRALPVFVKSKLDLKCVRARLGIASSQLEQYQTLITLPSFNDLIIGIQINRPKSHFMGPLFENNCANLSSSEVYSKNGINLGTVSNLKDRFTATFSQRNH